MIFSTIGAKDHPVSSCRPQLFDSSPKQADFKGLVKSIHAIVSAHDSDHLRRFCGRIHRYAAVFQDHNNRGRGKSIPA